MTTSIEFQKRFQELVKELDTKNKTDCAKKIDISYITFSRIYNYGIIPKTSILVKLADFFNVSIEYLLGYTDNEYFEKSDLPQTFQKRLKELEKEKEIPSTYDLSEKIHIHRNNINQWVNKNYIPVLEDLETVADFFRVSLDYLLGRTDYKTL